MRELLDCSIVRIGRLNLCEILLGDLVDLGASRIAESEKLRRLVESLARGIVKGLSDDLVASVFRHVDPVRMSARNGEAKRRRTGFRTCLGGLRPRIVEERRMQVGLDVVDADQRNLQRPRKSLRGVKADDQRRREAGAVRDGHRIDREVGHGRTHHLADLLDMGAGCDLRHDAAIRHMQGNLRVNDIVEDFATVLHDRRRRLVTACLNSQYVQFF